MGGPMYQGALPSCHLCRISGLALSLPGLPGSEHSVRWAPSTVGLQDTQVDRPCPSSNGLAWVSPQCTLLPGDRRVRAQPHCHQDLSPHLLQAHGLQHPAMVSTATPASGSGEYWGPPARHPCPGPALNSRGRAVTRPGPHSQTCLGHTTIVHLKTCPSLCPPHSPSSLPGSCDDMDSPHSPQDDVTETPFNPNSPR